MFQRVDPKSLDLNVFSAIGEQWMLITAGTVERCNTMTASWGGLGILWNKPMAIAYIRPQRYTKQFVDEQDYFTLTFFSGEYRSQLALCGTKSGRDVDKVKECGFTVAAGVGGAPYFEGAVSIPYIDMTIETLERFGVEVMYNEGDYTQFYVEGGQEFKAIDYTIESDWSAAASIMVAAAIAGEVTINNISTLSRQADTAVCRALERAGASLIIEENSITVAHRPLEAFEFDATQCPDLFPALVALAAAAEGVSTITGIKRLRGKESDRGEALRAEYEKLGIDIELDYDEDVMRVVGGTPHSANVDSHDDHRIAMSLAITALRIQDEVVIRGRESVAKSYPSFFEDIESLKSNEGE